jgi:hypothetical protein
MPDVLTLDSTEEFYLLGKRRFERVSRVLESLGLSRDYSGIDPFYAERGRAAHRVCELMDKGTLDESSLTDITLPYFKGYREFVKKSGYSPLAYEIKLHHDAGGFAGTIDKVGTLNGRTGILDVKTSSSVDPAVELQLCAYQLLWEASHPNQPVKFRYVLQLKTNGTYSLITKYSDAIPATYWLSIMDTFHWKQKNVRSAPTGFSRAA